MGQVHSCITIYTNMIDYVSAFLSRIFLGRNATELYLISNTGLRSMAFNLSEGEQIFKKRGEGRRSREAPATTCRWLLKRLDWSRHSSLDTPIQYNTSLS